MSAHELFNLFNKLGEKIRCETLTSILSISPNKFNKSTNTGARMRDSIICHITLKWHLIRDFHIKLLPLEKTTFLWTSTHNITEHIKVICIFNLPVDCRF